MPPMEGPGCAGIEKKSSDSAREGGAALLAAAVWPGAALGAEKASAKGSALCCIAGAALGPGALSWAKGSAACSIRGDLEPLQPSFSCQTSEAYC